MPSPTRPAKLSDEQEGLGDDIQLLMGAAVVSVPTMYPAGSNALHVIRVLCLSPLPECVVKLAV